MPSSSRGDGSGFFPINLDLSRLLPNLKVDRGGLRYPKCTLQVNSLPVVIKGGHGLMLRFSAPFGYLGSFECQHLDIHDEDNLLTVRVKGTLRTNVEAHTVELLHVESRHDGTGRIASLMQTAMAHRRTIKAKNRTGRGTFVLELFRPETV